MPISPLPADWEPNDIIPSQWANNIAAIVAQLDARTGPADPLAANRWLQSTGGTTASWVDRAAAVLGAIGYTPLSISGGRVDGRLEIQYPGAAGGPQNWQENQLMVTGVAGGYPAISLHQAGVSVAVLYAATGELWTMVGATTPGRLWHSANDGSGSTLDADTLDGHDSGHTFNTIPIADQAANPFLNAGQFEGHTYAQAKADIAGSVPGASVEVPNGVIAMWLGGMTAPAGWVIETRLANLLPAGVVPAQNGTFGGLGASGGAASHTHAPTDHTHAGAGHTHSGTVHNHSGANMTIAGTAAATGSTNGLYQGPGGATAVTTGHTHPVTGTVGGNTENDGGGTTGGASAGTTGGASVLSTGGPLASGLPPYRTVLFIARVAMV